MSRSRCKLCACHAAIAYEPSDLGTRESRINGAGSCRPLARVGHAPASHVPQPSSLSWTIRVIVSEGNPDEREGDSVDFGGLGTYPVTLVAANFEIICSRFRSFNTAAYLGSRKNLGTESCGRRNS